MNLKIVNPCEVTSWNDLIQNFNSYSFFHTSEWAEVLSSTYKYKPVYFLILNGDKITSIIPAMTINSYLTGKRLVSLPFSDVCDPLLDSEEDSEKLKDSIIDYCVTNNLKFIEFRSSEATLPFKTENFRIDFRHVLYLNKTEEELLKSFTDNTKRNIKKASKEKVTVENENNEYGIKVFYKMQCETRKKHGLPPQPFSFYQNINRFIISKNQGEILIAKQNGRPLAAAVFLCIGKKVLYKFGASHSRHNLCGSNHLVMWEAIKKFNGLGYELLDFGRTEKEHQGLRRYKLSFNTSEKNIYTTKFDIKTKKFIPAEIKTRGFYNRVFSRSPITVLKIIGNTLYKHVG